MDFMMEVLGDLEVNSRIIPVARNEFKTEQSFPFVIYYSDGSINFFADGSVFHSRDKYVVEVYTEKKEGDLEDAIEERLNQHELSWEKTSDMFIESESMYMVAYYVES